MANRYEAFQEMKRKKRVYHRRLGRVIEGVAFCNGREIASSADVDEAQAIMWAEYLEISRW
jgi:hypothetical protein